MIPVAFDYVRPESVDAAVALLGERGEDASVLAGGHSLLPLMKLRFARARAADRRRAARGPPAPRPAPRPRRLRPGSSRHRATDASAVLSGLIIPVHIPRTGRVDGRGTSAVR